VCALVWGLTTLVAMQNLYRYPDLGDRLTAAVIQRAGIGRSEWRRQELEVLDRFVGRLTAQLPRRRFLDYGSGEGRLSPHFAALFQHMTVYEPDGQRRARHAQRIRCDGGSVELVASFNPTTATDKFDAALCSHVIQHIARDAVDAVLGDLAAAIRQGGTLLLLTTFTDLNGCGTPRYVVSRLDADGEVVDFEVDAVRFDVICRRNVPGELPIHFFGMAELMGALAHQGFRVVETYGLHGNEGVVGPIEAPWQPGRPQRDAEGRDVCPSCRDVAIIAIRE
jgi:SAM-dependent methyltransferase